MENPTNQPELRKLPAIEKILLETALRPGIEHYSRFVVTQAAQTVMERLRLEVMAGGDAPKMERVVQLVKAELCLAWPGFLMPVINGTGVMLHTNLGRAPLSESAVKTLAGVLGGYYALELNLRTGERGERALELEKLFCLLTGAESALVVNNNAAAVLLILAALARGKEVMISRGELVQIGGGFRVPEVMAESGAILKEVGTTNQTHPRDFEQAINEQTAMLLKVHPSNFAMRGFVHDVGIGELRDMARNFGLPVIYDIGSGAMLNTEEYGMAHEPTVQQALSDGADLVCFSGDKLFGGPQAGIIVGKKVYIDQLRRHSLLRAVRIDKVAAIALTVTVLAYLNKNEAGLPVYRMMGAPLSQIETRAQAVCSRLKQGGIESQIIDGESLMGGGALPDETLKSRLLSVTLNQPADEIAKQLRLGNPPVVARTQGGRLLIDLRTVFPAQDALLTGRLLALLGSALQVQQPL